MTALRTLRWAAACLAIAAGCGEPAEVAAPAEPLPPGNLLPESVETILFGSPSACREDADCVSAVCHYGACGGLISVDTRWMQERVAAVLTEHLDGDPALRERVVFHLGRILRRPRTELALRARAALGLEKLGAADVLEAALPDLPDSVAEVASVSLVRLERPAGLPLTLALTEHESLPVAADALRALGDSGLPEALPGLLRSLAPDLDQALQRAALDGAAALGDARAVGPLIAYLADAPEALVVHTGRALRQLTGAALPATVEAWRAWAKEHPPPAPPPFTLRKDDTAEELGLPTP